MSQCWMSSTSPKSTTNINSISIWVRNEIKGVDSLYVASAYTIPINKKASPEVTEEKGLPVSEE